MIVSPLAVLRDRRNTIDTAPDSDLQNLAEGVEKFTTAIESNPTLGLICIGVKIEDTPENEDDPEVSTFITVAGLAGVIAEGLYSELASQIEDGNLSFASVVAGVIADLQHDYNIDLLNPPTEKKKKAKLYVVPKSDPTVH